jgi:hypothetical protein
LRVDRIVLDQQHSSDPSYYQGDVVAGVGYKFSNNIRLRAEESAIHGYGLPVARGEVQPGQGKPNWHLLGVSLNFIF